MPESDPRPAESATTNPPDLPVSQPAAARPQAPMSRTTRWVVGLAVALVVGPLLYYAARREIAKWYQAASHTRLYAGDYEDALKLNEKAMQWNAQDYNVWSDRVALNMAMRDTEAAVHASERLLELARAAYERRHSPMNQAILAQALNSCAYALALDNAEAVDQDEIERALKLVNESLDLAIEDANILDTRGYLYYLAGDTEKAIADTERAVALMERSYKRRLHNTREQSRGYVDRSQFEYLQAQIHEGMAILIAHRGLAYERAGKTEAAKRDFRRAEELGYDPHEGLP